jgi:hypothetical protein
MSFSLETSQPAETASIAAGKRLAKVFQTYLLLALIDHLNSSGGLASPIS